jgi:hypothetical protein
MLEAEMTARLKADTALAVLIEGKVFPFEAPANTPPPYVIYRRDDTAPDDTLTDSASVHHVMMSIEAHGASYKEAAAIGAALKPILDGWRGDPPAAVMSMTYAGEHDAAGSFDEESRRRRTFARELIFAALIRA